MRTGTDTTRAGKTRKKAAKIPGSKSSKKSMTRLSSDAVQQTVIDSQSHGSLDVAAELQSTESVLSGNLTSFNCLFYNIKSSSSSGIGYAVIVG